jgi:phenylalanyl-tRNA synthetase beta chain
MKFSETWLRQLVDIPVDRDALVHRLTMSGLEVEGVEPIGAALDGVVVAEIVGCEPHPNADKLRVCQVATGQSTVQIVCGAPNARVGLKAPLATIGAKLPNGMEIKQAALRGVDSHGMLCSAKELGIDADASGLMELPPDAPVGEPVAKFLGLPDASLELKLTPNRPDCLSMLGLARDIGALFASALHPPQIKMQPDAIATKRAIRLDAGADCPRFVGRVIEGIDPGARSPLWLVERLRRSGSRSISAVVDITNYVMLELGQPLHAFDNAKVSGTVVVRRARNGEKLKLLDGSEHALSERFLVVADDNDALALGGIMGGWDSRVTDATKDVFFEAAHWAPPIIMGRSRELALHSDAAHRFERGVDPELPRKAIERATELLITIAGGSAGPIVEAVRADDLPVRAPVVLRRARLARVLDVLVEDADVERILSALGLRVERVPDGWRATPPSWRFDIEIEEDLIEEVIRVHGYERVPTRAPRGELRVPPMPEARLRPDRFRDQLAARDYVEAVCFAFLDAQTLRQWQLDDGAVALANPLSAELGVMRTSLLPGLVSALLANRNRQQERVRLFEIGNVFAKGADAPVETMRIAGVASGSAFAEQWGETPRRPVDFFDLKGDVESMLALTHTPGEFRWQPAAVPWLHPGQSAELHRGGRRVGFVGALHPVLVKTLDAGADVYAFEIDLDAIAARPLPSATAVSRYPSVRRDLSFELPESVPYAEVEATIRDAVGENLADIILFDRYAGPNLGTDVKSLAIGLILQDRYRTLTDQDADRCRTLAVAALEAGCKAKLRG